MSNNLQYEPMEALSLRKSNTLVSAKYKSSLIENQIMAIALTRIEVSAASGKGEDLIARLFPGELKRLVGDPHNIYSTLKVVQNTIRGHSIFIEDGKNFRAHSIVTDAVYQDGVFIIRFNDILKDYILNLENNYTTYELSILTSFKKSSAFRLYEVLKSHIYRSRKSVNDGRVDVEYNIAELRFMIGLANSDDPAVSKAAARMGSNVDWDVLYEKLDKKDQKYSTWADFQRYVLRPAQKELEQKSNIRFEYKGQRKNRKMNSIIFYVYPNEPQIEDELNAKSSIIQEGSAKLKRQTEQFVQLEMPRDQYPELYEDFMGHNGLEKEDIDFLMYKAGYDDVKVRRMIELADKQPHINNYMGWIMAAIEANYSTTETIDGSAARAQYVNDVIKGYNESKSETALRVWERVKQKEEYAQFYEDLKASMGKPEQFEMFFDVQERLDIYYEWKKNGVISI